MIVDSLDFFIMNPGLGFGYQPEHGDAALLDAGIEPVDLMHKGIQNLRARHFAAVNRGGKRGRAEIRDF